MNPPHPRVPALPPQRATRSASPAHAGAREAGFREAVYAVVRQVPPGAVTTYGDVAGVLGQPGYARQVGYALAALMGATTDVPWHRVINARGTLSFRGDDLRGAAQRARLVHEGVRFGSGGRVENFAQIRARFALREGLHGG